MMLSAHSSVSEDSEKWRIFAHQPALNDLSSSSEDEQQPQLRNADADEENVLKRTKSLEKRVSFPSDQSKLVSHFIEPQADDSGNVAECQAEEATCQTLVDIYTISCEKNVTQPIENIVEQLKTLDLENPRSANLTLRGLTLGPHDCESLEDVLKHVPLKLLDLGASHSSDDGLIALFDMIEFCEAASHVSFAAHKNMTTRGWQACCRMIKRTQCLEWLDAAQIGLSEHSSTLLAKALRADSCLRVLQLNGCSLSGRPMSIIASSLRINKNLRELYLAENKLTQFDALQLGILLTGNDSLQIIDLRNNEIRDRGMVYLCDALLDNRGLVSLTVWNNGITHAASPALKKLLAGNQSMRTLNLGCNKLGDQGLMDMIPGGLEHNRSLHNLGLQANNLTCCAIISLAESLASGTRLHRVDLRKNAVQLAGLMALAAAMKLCPTVTCLDLNVTSSENSEEYDRLSGEISALCAAHQSLIEEPATTETPENHEECVEADATASPTVTEDLSVRKVSLTCPLPLLPCVPVIVTDEGQEEEQQQERVARKFRSPLPSPMPSPLPSPVAVRTPAISASRFKVSRVDLTSASLPASCCRFTVTPVSESSSSRSFSGSSSDLMNVDPPISSATSAPNQELIRRSPSKIVVGFDVVPDDDKPSDT